MKFSGLFLRHIGFRFTNEQAVNWATFIEVQDLFLYHLKFTSIKKVAQLEASIHFLFGVNAHNPVLKFTAS